VRWSEPVKPVKPHTINYTVIRQQVKPVKSTDGEKERQE
jgi:hypothetical protein